MLPESVRLVVATAEDDDRLADMRVETMRPTLEDVGRFDPLRARVGFLETFFPADIRIILLHEAIAGFFGVLTRADHLYLDHLYIL